ncbi:hypothetical protein GCM10028820_06170 [Tessaracoccus terricola]
MTARNVLRVTAVMVIAVLAGVLAVQGTWALWNSAVASGAQSVRAADFQVNLNGNPTIVDGSAVTVSLGDVGTLTPGATIHAAVNATVPTDAGAEFTVLATVGSPQVQQASVAALPDHLRFQVAPAPGSGKCADVAAWTPTATATIGKGGAAGFCVQVQMLPGAPESLQGATATIAIPVSVTQTQ